MPVAVCIHRQLEVGQNQAVLVDLIAEGTAVNVTEEGMHGFDADDEPAVEALDKGKDDGVAGCMQCCKVADSGDCSSQPGGGIEAGSGSGSGSGFGMRCCSGLAGIPSQEHWVGIVGYPGA